MKIILLSASLICFTSIFAQVKEIAPLSNNTSKFTFGWVYSPEVSYRILGEGSEADESTNGIIDSRNNAEMTKFGQSFGFFTGYQLSKTFSLEAGLGYTDFGAGLKPVDIVDPGDINFVYGTRTGSNHIHVASVPITFHVNFGGKKLKGFVSTGIAPSLFLGYTYSRTDAYTSGNKVTTNYFYESQQDDYEKFILVANLSAGIEYQYNAKASLRIAPVFRVSTTNVLTPGPISGHYFNAGLEIGTIYKF